MTELAVLDAASLALAGALARLPRAHARAQADRLNVVAALVTAAVALALAATARSPAPPLRDAAGSWSTAASGVFLAVIAVVGLCSALVSPSYLRTSGRSWFTAARSRRAYYAALLRRSGPRCWSCRSPATSRVVWLVVEATTAASALLVAFTGRREALEAGWKYLVLTTLGLSVALLGIVVLAIGAGGPRPHRAARARLARARGRRPRSAHEATLVAFVLIIAGLATKIGWAPVHNWLPDAHSEAPAPISALLSAALLPTVAARRLARRSRRSRPPSGRAPPARCSSASAWPR